MYGIIYVFCKMQNVLSILHKRTVTIGNQVIANCQ